MVLALELDALFNSERNLVTPKTALTVVYVDEGFCFFLGSVDIFLKVTPHEGSALVNAAPSLNLRLFLLLLILFEFDWLLSYREHLLILHFLIGVNSVHLSLHVVLYFGFGLLTFFLVLEADGGG